MRFFHRELIRLNREIRHTNSVAWLCWIINDIGVNKGMIDAVEDARLFSCYTKLTIKAMEKMRELKCTSY